MRQNIFLLVLGLSFGTTCWGMEEVDQLRPETFGSAKNIRCPIQIVPGKSFGDLKIGMSREEVAKLKMVQKNLVGSKIHQIVGMYSVQYSEQNKVIDIGADIKDLPDCLNFGETKIKQTALHGELEKLFKSCRDRGFAAGGATTECQGIWIQSGGWGGKQKSPTLRVHGLEYGARKF